MKSKLILLTFAIAFCVNAFPQIINVSPNANFIAVQHSGLAGITDAFGKILYTTPPVLIKFTSNELYYYYNTKTAILIFEAETGSFVDSIPVADEGFEVVAIEDNLQRYIYENNRKIHYCNRNSTNPLLVTRGSMDSDGNLFYADFSFQHNIAVEQVDKGINIYDLSNIGEPVSVKLKKANGISIDKINEKIIVGYNSYDGIILNFNGEEVKSYKKNFRTGFTSANTDWWIDRGYFGCYTGPGGRLSGSTSSFAFFSGNAENIISVYKDNKFITYSMVNKEIVNTITLDSIINNPENRIKFITAKEEKILKELQSFNISKGSDLSKYYNNNYQIVKFAHKEKSDFTEFENYSHVQGHKFKYSNDTYGDGYYYVGPDKKFTYDYRIEAMLNFYEGGSSPFIGIYDGYLEETDQFVSEILINPDGKCKVQAVVGNEKEFFTYAVNQDRARNKLVIDKTGYNTKIYLNDALVHSESKKTRTEDFGLLAWNQSIGELDYVMISGNKDERYYKAWRKKEGFMFDPFLTADFQGHAGEITDLKISPDGKEVVTCGLDKTVRIWDIKTGENIRTFRSEAGAGDIGVYAAVAISPDQKYIAAGGYFSDEKGAEMGHVRFFNYETGKLVHVYDRLNSNVTTIEFSPPETPFNEQLLLIATSNGMNHFQRYHKLKKSLDKGQFDAEYKTGTYDIEKKSYIKDFVINPKHDQFLCVLQKWKNIRVFNFNHSTYGEGATSFEIESDIGSTAACYSAGYDSIFVIHGQRIHIYDIQGTKLGEVPCLLSSVSNNLVKALPNGKEVIVDEYEFVKIDIKTGKKTKVDIAELNPASICKVSANGNLVFNAHSKHFKEGKEKVKFYASQAIGVYNVNTQKLSIFKSNALDIEGVAFASDNDGIVTVTGYSYWFNKADFTSKDIVNYFDFNTLQIKNHDNLQVSNNLISELNGFKLERWGNDENGVFNFGRMRFGEKSVQFEYNVKAFTLTPKGSIILATDFELNAYNQEGDKIRQFVGHSGGVISMALSSNGNRMLTLGSEGVINLWDLSDETEIVEPLATFVFSNNNDWICATKGNYYASSKYGTKFMGFWQNRGTYSEAEFIPFDQFGIAYNRPDIVMTQLGIGETAMKHAYQKAVVKRLIKTNTSVEPKINSGRLPYIMEISPSKVVNSLQQKFMVKACDGNSSSGMSHFNFWINDVQVFPEQPKASGSDLTFETTFNLAPGPNIISVQPVTKTGSEGIRKQVNYYADVDDFKPNLYLVAVGVSEYQNSEMNLRFAAKDATDVVEQFKTSGLFGQVHAKLITNDDATRNNISQAKELLKKAESGDVAMIYFAGHGLLSAGLDWYFATTDVNFELPEIKGLSYSEIEGLFENINCRNRLLLLDACHSGEVDKSNAVLASNGSIAANVGARGFKTVEKPKIGLDNSFALMQTMFADTERGTGAVVISSAGGAEFAFESSEWQNGLFTYCLLNGLKNNKADTNNDGAIKVSELRNFVIDEVKTLSKGKQTPTTRKENISNDFRVW